MNEVRDLLQSGNGYTFEEGISLMEKYCVNQNAVSFLARKRDMRQLAYELGKLARFPKLVPNPGYNTAVVVQAKPEPQQSFVSAVETAGTEKQETKHIEQRSVDENEDVDNDIVKWQDLDRYKHTRFEDMLTDFASQQWLVNQQQYQLIKQLHLKMRNAETDEERAELRKELLEEIAEHQERWKVIDEENARAEKQASEKAEEKPAEADIKKISNCRAYISKALKEKEISVNKLAELKRRAEYLIAAKVEISDETLARLKELKVI